MINLRDDILNALKQNTSLVELLGTYKGLPAIFNLNSPDDEIYPRITFFELNNVDQDYADNQPINSLIRFQIDIWSKGNPINLANEINKTMESLGFVRTFTTDLYESDLKVYHKPIRFKIYKEAI